MSIKSFLALAAMAIFAVVLIDFAVAYVRSQSAGAQRWIDAGKGSATMIVAQLGALVGLVVAASDTVTDWVCSLLNAPGADEAIKQGIQQWVTPTNVGLVLAGFAALVAWARTRTLGKG